MYQQTTIAAAQTTHALFSIINKLHNSHWSHTTLAILSVI